MLARLKPLLKFKREDRYPICGEVVPGEGVVRYGKRFCRAWRRLLPPSPALVAAERGLLWPSILAQQPENRGNLRARGAHRVAGTFKSVQRQDRERTGY